MADIAHSFAKAGKWVLFAYAQEHTFLTEYS